MNKNTNIHILARAVILDADHILVCKTTDMPHNFYFLPGGHVEHGESAQVALLRELLEETGAEATIKRFLGCLEFSFEPGYSSFCHNHEYNFIFEVEAPSLSVANKVPQLEAHIELTWVPMNKINEIDFRAEPLRVLIPQWLKSTSDNGTFQSVMR